jgi:anti-sigma-K factor RskA
MSDEKERAELLAALHAAGAASEEDEQELQALLEADPGLQEVVRDFQDSIAALTSPKTLGRIQQKIAKEKGGFLGRLRSWFSKS